MTPNYDEMLRRTSDPVESAFIEVCKELKVKLTVPQNPGGKNLDFYLPDFELFVECKAYACPRMVDQLNSVDPNEKAVVCLIGLKAVKVFGNLLDCAVF